MEAFGGVFVAWGCREVIFGHFRASEAACERRPVLEFGRTRCWSDGVGVVGFYLCLLFDDGPHRFENPLESLGVLEHVLDLEHKADLIEAHLQGGKAVREITMRQFAEMS